MVDVKYTDVYRLLKYSLNAEMASFNPMELMEIPNIWFDYSSILNNAESDYKGDK